jgi:retinol dehydrogenase 12
MEVKTALVTGANAGIGREIVRGLARSQFHVMMAVRSLERGEEARRDIEATVPGCSLETGLVDLASQRSIRAFATQVLAGHDRLDVLVNNAGSWSTKRLVSPEGFEQTWATNQLGYFLLTELLRPLLVRSAPARIVSVASELAVGLDLSDVNLERRGYNGVGAYAQSKQANRMWTRALARRLAGTGVTANSLHPGGVNTGLFGKGGGLLASLAQISARIAGRTAEKGAETAVWLAMSPQVSGASGGFYKDCKLRSCKFADEAEEERLFALCARMTSTTIASV